jgi:hypothetical protein
LRVGSCHGIGYSAEASTSAQLSKMAMQNKNISPQIVDFQTLRPGIFLVDW